MKKSDLGVVGVVYGIIALFLFMSLGLDKATRRYPLVILAILFILTTIYCFQMYGTYKKEGIVSGEEFENFYSKQFFIVLSFIILYVLLMFKIGFYFSSVLFLVSTLKFLKVDNLRILVTTLAVLLIVYLAFTRFLGVNLPKFNLF